MRGRVLVLLGLSTLLTAGTHVFAQQEPICPQGTLRDYWPEAAGRIAVGCSTKDRIRHGPVLFRDDEGQLVVRGQYDNGKKIGLWVIHRRGWIREEVWDGSDFPRKTLVRDEGGQKRSSVILSERGRIESSTSWYENGQLRYDIRCVEHRRNGRCSTYSTKSWTELGELAEDAVMPAHRLTGYLSRQSVPSQGTPE